MTLTDISVQDSIQSTTPSVSFFAGASHIQFSGCNHFQGTVSDALCPHTCHYNLTSNPIQYLLQHCSADSLVNSKERYMAPRCASVTRDDVNSIIIQWANSSSGKPAVLWLYGSAGVGKSAICQTIAEMFMRQGLLLGSFFFSRSSSSPGRSSGDRLLPTLVYQLYQILPETRWYIEDEIKRNPLIFQATRATQMSALFVRPLDQFSLSGLVRSLMGKRIGLVVIDGLDECQDPTIQCDLLRVIANATQSLSTPVRFLIASRSESNIQHTFLHDPSFRSVDLELINLDDDPGARQSIFHFFHIEFNKIHETHPLRLYLDPSWPSESLIEVLVSKSSPQFILAATIMNYVSDPNGDHPPDARLNAILAILECRSESVDHLERPLENIDKLYRFILAGVKPKHRHYVWSILGIIHIRREHFCVPTPSPIFFRRLFNLPGGTIESMLRPLASIITIPTDNADQAIQSLHVSLFDFLLEPRRSGPFAIDLQNCHLSLAIFYLGSEELFELQDILHDRNAGDRNIQKVGEVIERVFCQIDSILERLTSFNIRHSLARIEMLSRIVRHLLDIKQSSAPGPLEHSVRLSRLALYDHYTPPNAPEDGRVRSTSIICQIKHSIHIGIIKQIIKTISTPGELGKSPLQQYFDEVFKDICLDKPFDTWDDTSTVTILHFLAAVLTLQTLPEIVVLAEKERIRIYRVGQLLIAKSPTLPSLMRSGLVHGCRELVLECFSKLAPDAACDVVEIWTKLGSDVISGDCSF